jgi:hypothetical protein
MHGFLGVDLSRFYSCVFGVLGFLGSAYFIFTLCCAGHTDSSEADSVDTIC